jgi:transforming growth factor-beta-induced protein
MMKFHKLTIAALTVASAIGGAAAVRAGGYDAKPKAAATAATATTQDIVTTAVAAGSFKTLVAAVQAAGLADLLKSEGPFTVFAPTDEAFAKLPPGTVEALLKDQAKLRTILTYHVVPGRVLAADVVKLKEAKTAEGRSVAIEAKDGVKVGGAKVVKTDILCTNGVIHVIDSVLLP